MVLNQCCQLSMELIKTYYELSIFFWEKNFNGRVWNEPHFPFFFKKKKGGGGGGGDGKIASPKPINPINRLCIGCGAVWQMWCYWWCGVARMVGGWGCGWGSHSLGVCQDLTLEENCTEFSHWSGIENYSFASVLSVEYGIDQKLLWTVHFWEKTSKPSAFWATFSFLKRWRVGVGGWKN